MYDGGKYTDQFGTVNAINDYLYDVKALSDGRSVCVGETRDTTGMQNVLFVKLDTKGKLLIKKLYRYKEGGGAFDCNNKKRRFYNWRLSLF